MAFQPKSTGAEGGGESVLFLPFFRCPPMCAKEQFSNFS
jgi:hypothetical protein